MPDPRPYIRRGRSVEIETERLFGKAAAAREELLPFVCLRFRQLLDLLDDETAATLGPETPDALTARPRRPRGGREVARAVAALAESVRRFNAKWERWVEAEAPLDRANAAIEGYNRHYAFERQCAVKYVPLDKLRMEQKPLLSRADVIERFPYLPLP